MKRGNKLFYGWWIVAGGFILNFLGVGIGINAIPVFLKPVVTDLHFNRGDFSLYFTIVALTMTFGAPLAGKLLEKYNVRIVMGASTLLLAAGFAAYSLCTTLTEFYIVSFFVGVGHAAAHIIPVSMLITNWFNKKRGLAMGVVFTASGLGGLFFSPVANHIITEYGWRNGYLALGLLIGVFCVPCAFFVMRKSPAEVGQLPDGAKAGSSATAVVEESGFSVGQAVKSPVFWLLVVMIFLIDAQAMGIQQHLPAYLTDRGRSASFAANLLGFYLGMIAVGKIILGYVSDRFGSGTGFAIFTCVLGGSLMFLFNTEELWSLALFAIAFGFGNAVITVSLPLMTAACFGMKNFGVIFGLLTIANALGAAVGTPGVGYLYDTTGSYNTAIWISVVITFVALAAGVLAMRLSSRAMAGTQA